MVFLTIYLESAPVRGLVDSLAPGGIERDLQEVTVTLHPHHQFDHQSTNRLATIQYASETVV